MAIVVGSGIFRVPSVVAGLVTTPRAMVALWVTGGVLSLSLALLLAELGSTLPRAGGTYAYLRAAFGDGVAFLFGWTFLFVNPAGWATLAVTCAEFLGQLLPIDEPLRRGVAVGLIAAFVLANARSARLGAEVQNVATGAKLVALVAGILVIATVTAPRPMPTLAASNAIRGAGGTSAWLTALVAVLWAYDGAAGLCSLGAEVRAPRVNIPRALLIGVAGVVSLYVAVNLSLLRALPVASIAESPLPLATAIALRIGAWGGGLVVLTVVIATASSLAGSVLADPRVFMAMARDGNFFPAIGALSARHHTPVNAIVLHGAIACVYVTVRTFEQLAETFILGLAPFYALTAIAAWRLRRRQPRDPAAFRAPALPLLAAVWIIAATLLIVNACIDTPGIVLIDLAVTALGWPVYRLWRRLRLGAALSTGVQ
jgi:amino acid transporter